MKNLVINLGLICQLLCFGLYGQYQEDTIVAYNISNNTRYFIPPVNVPATITAAHSNYSFGTSAGIQSLLTGTPQTNLIQNSNFTKLSRAVNFYSITSFPVRTAVKVLYYSNNFKGIATGMLVGECMVVTAGNIIFSSATGSGSNNFSFDSIRVLPAFDNGVLPPGFQSSLAEKIYVFKRAPSSGSFVDIALLKLSLPIGASLGYTGLGFNSDTSFIQNKLFHKFSYPAVKDFADTNKVYNGDTLYYNYGLIKNISIYYGIGGGAGLPGQGGSTFLHFDGTDYYNIGTLSYSSNSMHYKISKNSYYQLKNILSTESCALNSVGIRSNEANLQQAKVFPNPVLDAFYINQSASLPASLTIKLFDFSGRCVGQLTSCKEIIEMPRNELPAGIYLLTVADENNNLQSFKLVFE